ncbi:MAG: ShlB/FhaC/HecB family hemolysin secretion/activation protein [Waterburya sp.]
MLSTALNFKTINVVNSAVFLTVINSSFTPVLASSIALPKSKTENKNIAAGDRLKSRYVAQLPNPVTPDVPPKPLPNPATPDVPPQPLPQLPSDRDIPFKSPQLPSTDAEDLLNIPGSISVKGFRFEGNTVFSDRELAKVTAPYTKKDLSFVELLQAEAAVRDKYLQGCDSDSEQNATQENQPCYVNSDAFIPIQKIEDGIITVQIVEGAIEDITITGTKYLPPNYIKSRLELVTQKQPFNLNELLEALRLLQLDPLIGSVSAELSAGVSPEKSLLTVKVTEAESFDFILTTDNNRSPAVGSWRRGLSFNEGNLLGFGDSFGFSWLNTDGSDSFDFSYGIPVNARNGEILLTGGFRNTEIIEEPFDRLDITGDSWYSELTFRQPVAQSAQEEFVLGFTLSRQESTTKLQGDKFPLSLGADDDGKTKISAIRFAQEWTKRNPKSVFAARSQFSLGLGIFDATVNDNLPDSKFFAWRGQGQYVRSLTRDTLLVLRSEFQLATDELLPLEQFSLGGFNTVRGYRQDFLLTDNAMLVSAEARLPILRAPEVGGVLQVIPFIDFGVGWNNGDLPNPNPNVLGGVGVGLQWQMQDRLNARFDWGIPLTDMNIEERTWQEQGLYFSVNYQLF